MDAHRSFDSPRRGGAWITVPQVIACGVVAASIGWSIWLVRDRPLNDEVELLPGTVLPSSEMAIVEAAFDRAQLTDHRTEDGRVWVPRPRQSAYMRALVDAEALPREFGSSLRRVLEKNSPWQSRAVQEELLRVAVQEELAHVICSMPGIERASVLYDCDHRGTGDGLAAGPLRTASVNIRTQPDTELEPVRVQAIRVLVAASIAGLTADRVAVTDLRSGQHYAGPLDAGSTTAEERAAAADPVLARRIAHERHLAAKVRQSIAFVKGAVVTVSVAFAPPQPAAASARRTETLVPARPQRAADANAPAEVGGQPAVAPTSTAPPDPPSEPSTRDGLESVLVSIAVPDTYLDAAVRSALEAEPTTNRQECERREQARIREHVLPLLPVTSDPGGRRVAVTVFPSAPARPVARQPVAAVRPTIPPPAVVRRDESAARTPGMLVDETWHAVVAGRPRDVPREAWLVVIGAATAALAWILLRGTQGPKPRGAPRRRTQPRIDWSTIDSDRAGFEAAAAAVDDHADGADAESPSRRVAA